MNIRHILVAFAMISSTYSFAQNSVADELVKINKFFDGPECFYVDMKLEYLFSGYDAIGEVQETFAAKLGMATYNKVGTMEYVQLTDLYIAVDNTSKTIMITSPLAGSNTESPLSGMLDKLMPMLEKCESTRVENIDSQTKRIVLEKCSANYPRIEVEYLSKTHQTRKITMEVLEPGAKKSSKVVVTYKQITKQATDTKGYLQMSRYVLKNARNYIINTSNYRGYTLVNPTNQQKKQ